MTKDEAQRIVDNCTSGDIDIDSRSPLPIVSLHGAFSAYEIEAVLTLMRANST